MKTKKSKGSFLANVGLDPETDYEIGFYYGCIFDDLSDEIQHDVIKLIGVNEILQEQLDKERAGNLQIHLIVQNKL